VLGFLWNRIGKETKMKPVQKEILIFAETSIDLSDYQFPARANLQRAIKHGDIERLWHEDVTDVVIIDGIFLQERAVWQREIKALLDIGINVYGAASMGALRAVELAVEGMVGVGEIYRMYQQDEIWGDDEVALMYEYVHGKLRKLTIPLVEVRYALTTLGITSIDSSIYRRIIEKISSVDFSRRTLGFIHEAIIPEVPQELVSEIVGKLQDPLQSIKRKDAQAVLRLVFEGKVAHEQINIDYHRTCVPNIPIGLKTANNNESQKHALLEHLGNIAAANGITRLAELTRLDKAGIPVWSAIKPASKAFLQVTAGKGLSAEEAKISCLMEAIEQIYAEQFDETLLIDGSVDNKSMMVSHEEIVKEAKKLTRIHIKEIIIHNWILGEELKTGRQVLMPLHWMYYCDEVESFGYATNGQAAGFTLEQAKEHAVLELYERHTISSASVDGIFRNDYFRQLVSSQLTSALERLKKQLEEVRLNFTCLIKEGDWPVAWCMLEDDEPLAPFLRINIGSKAARSLEAAVMGGILEACQQRCSVIQGTREDLKQREYLNGYPDISKVLRFFKAHQPITQPDWNLCTKPLEDLLSLMPGNIYMGKYDIKEKDLYSVKVIAPDCALKKAIF
jgi:YcaO-like protein with predicted kinase domain